MDRIDTYRIVRRRPAEAGFKVKLGCHVFRDTGITGYLKADGMLKHCKAMATAKLYDCRGDEITLDE